MPINEQDRKQIENIENALLDDWPAHDGTKEITETLLKLVRKLDKENRLYQGTIELLRNKQMENANADQ